MASMVVDRDSLLLSIVDVVGCSENGIEVGGLAD